MSQIETIAGNQLPNMPSGTGNSEKLMLFGIRKDTGETVLFHVSDLIKALEDGEYIPGLAEDLNIKSGTNVSHHQTAFVETTGGDQDVNSSKKAYVKSVRGTDGGVQASGALIRATGFNQIKPSGISGQVATFIAVASAWGEYGKSTENNGYLFTNEDNEIVVPVSVTQGGASVPTHTHSGVVYYLPENNGEVVATFASGVDVTEICAHICWSNYRDTDNDAYTAEEISLAGVITSVGGTLQRVTNTLGQSVFDEIVMSTVAAERQWYRRVGSAVAQNLGWAVETITAESMEGTVTSYRFAATISAMKPNGVFSLPGCAVTGFYTNGNVLMVESSTISTVAALQAALGSTQVVKYELASVVTGTHSLNGELTVEDFGTIMLISGSATSVDMDIELASYWRDVVKNTPSNIESDGRVTAAALVALEERIAKIERGISQGLSKLVVEDLTVLRKMSAYLVDDGTNDAAMIIERAGAPAAAPKFVGQRYINKTNGNRYTAKGVSASTDWSQD